MRKIVVIGDIIMSQFLEERSKVQLNLVSAFNQVNKNNASIASPYTITLGDEFQAVYNNANQIFHDIFYILYRMHPIQIRFAISIGDIVTRINRITALGMDGPAFYNARILIEELKKEKYLFKINEGEIECIKIINNYFDLLSDNLKNWSKLRWGLLISIMEDKGFEKISKKLKITNRSIYKNIEAGNITSIINFSQNTSQLINNLMK